VKRHVGVESPQPDLLLQAPRILVGGRIVVVAGRHAAWSRRHAELGTDVVGDLLIVFWRRRRAGRRRARSLYRREGHGPRPAEFAVEIPDPLCVREPPDIRLLEFVAGVCPFEAQPGGCRDACRGDDPGNGDIPDFHCHMTAIIMNVPICTT